MNRVTEPRFPDVPVEAGHYESFYVKLGDPERPRAAWIRYTVHKRPGAGARGSLWFTFFDASQGAPRAVKLTVDPGQTRADADGYIRIGDSTLGPEGLRGAAAAEGIDAAWDLRIESAQEPYRHLPRPWMYSARLPRTKLLSPHPAARYSGWIELDGERIEVASWPGMVGHNWGAEHAERWIWLHGTNFEGRRPEDAWLDAALGRIKVGPLTTPWIGNARLVLDGRAHRLGGIERLLSTNIAESPERLELDLAGDGVEVHGLVEAPRAQIVCWVYADPDGGEHNTSNCSVARMTLTVTPGDGDPIELVTEWGCAYELGMRETDHGLAVQPFPDG